MFESKINRGRANGYAPLGSSGKVPLDYLPPIQSTLDTGSFATTGSNTFTGVQTLAGTSGTAWAELTIGQTDIFGNYNSYDIRATGSSAVGISLTSDILSVVGVVDTEVGPAGNTSVVFSGKYGFPYSDGPFTGIGVWKSGSQEKVWIYDYTATSNFPGDINIGYDTIIGTTSGSLNIRNGNINLSGSLNIESPAPPTLSIGSNYGGGKVAYIMTASDAGYDSNYIKGVIAAEFDQASSTNWDDSNMICGNLVSGGFDDWRMPTLNELTKLYTNRIAIGSFDLTDAYWSSTEYLNDGGAYLVNFSDGGSVSGDPKYNTAMATRAVRSFSVATGNALNINGNSSFTGNINLSGSLNISSSMIISSTVVNNGSINALNSDLIIDGGDIILSGSMYVSGGIVFPDASIQTTAFNPTTYATTGSNTFIANQTIVGNVTFPSSSFISTTNASGGLYLSALNQGTLQLNADGGEGDVIIGRSGWDGKLMVNGNQIITGSVNIKKPIISIGQDLEGGKVAYILQSGDIGYDETLIQGIIAAESDEIQLLSFTLANEACDIKTTNGYSDWYLPSLMELDILHTNRVAIGGFVNDYYWSSSESQALVAWMQNFTNGDQEEFAESYQGYVRAIRIFSIPNEKALNVEGDTLIDGNIILSGSLIQQINYAPFGSGSWSNPFSDITQLDITKDIHLLDVTGIDSANAWFLPDGLYDGQVVRFALKGDGTANESLVRVYMNNLRTASGTIQSGVDWAPFYCGEAPTGPCRSLATALYIDGAWNIDTDWWDMGY